MRWCLFGFLLVSLVLTARADTALDQDIVVAANRFRLEERRKPLRPDPLLAALARQHAQDMASGKVKFGHAGFSGRSRQMMRELPGCLRTGENVAMRLGSTVSGPVFVAQWRDSRPHRRNLLDDFDLTGVGTARDARGAVYAVQLFAQASGNELAADSVAPAPAPHVPEVSRFGLEIGAGRYRTR